MIPPRYSFGHLFVNMTTNVQVENDNGNKYETNQSTTSHNFHMGLFNVCDFDLWKLPLGSYKNETFMDTFVIGDNSEISASSFHFVLRISFILLPAVIIAIIIFGNALVLMTITVSKRSSTVHNWMVGSLATGDLLVGLLVMPPSLANRLLGYWALGQVTCDIWLASDASLCAASNLTVMGMAVDWYFSIVKHVGYIRIRNQKRAILIVIWFVAVTTNVMPFTYWKRPREYKLGRPLCNASRDPGYVIFRSSSSFYIPMTIATAFYVMILFSRKNNQSNLLRHPEKLIPRSKSSIQGRSMEVVPERTGSNLNGELEMAGRSCNRNGAQPFCTEEASKEAAKSFDRGNGSKDVAVGNKFLSSGSVTTPRFEDELKSDGNSIIGIDERLHAGLDPSRSSQVNSRMIKSAKCRERRAVVVLGVLLVSFVGCWLPLFIFSLLQIRSSLHPSIAEVLLWLGYCKSTLNPIIYSLVDRNFKASIRRLLTGSSR